MAKTLTILGATGIQGGSIVAAMLNHPTYKLRAITRNIASDKARKLSAQGIEVVQANSDDVVSLKHAFQGSQAIFGLTNFFEPLFATGSVEQAMDDETRQGKNIAEAAAATEGLEHYLWSSLPNASRNTNGRLQPSYTVSKNEVDDYIRNQLPSLWEKTTLVWFGWYAGNMAYPIFAPHPFKTNDNSDNHFLHISNVPGDAVYPMLGHDGKNFGVWVKAILEQPSKVLPGKAVAAITEYMTLEEFATAYDKCLKADAKTHLIQVNQEKYEELFPVWANAIGHFNKYMKAVPESFSSVNGEIEVVRRENLTGLEGLIGTVEAFREMVAAKA